MLRSIGLLLLITSVFTSTGQEPYTQIIKGLPTEEVFDVFADSKGFIWVGHSLGLSRYDGQVFRHFASEEQTSLGMTRMCEDKQGRIWCHNFNGQIFYIENERMHLMKGYDASGLFDFPDITVIDSEFIATSNRGLFVCNTFTMKSMYLPTPSKNGATQTVCVTSGQVIVHDNELARFYRYVPGKHLAPIFVYDSLLNVTNRALVLTTADKKGLLYAFDNEKTQTYTLKISNDTLRVISRSKAPGVINTIVNCNDSIWVNTKQRTYVLGGTDTVYGKNITDIIIDGLGTRWQTSLQSGLQMQPRYKGWQKSKISYIASDDFIRCMITRKGHLLYGTQNGKVVLVSNGKPVMSLNVPPRAGSIENLFLLPNGQVIVAPSLGLYLADIETRKLYHISDIATAKALVITDTSILIGYAKTLVRVQLNPQFKEKLLDPKKRRGFEQHLRKGVVLDINLLNKRCLDVSYNIQSKETYALFKTGLARVVNDSIKPVLFQNQPINAISLIQANDGVLYIGTLNAGLLIKKGDHFSRITTNQGLSSNTIRKMKLFQGQLVMIEPGYMQVLDTYTRRFIATIPLPKENTGTVYDFLVENGKAYLNFTNYQYELRLDNLLTIRPKAYIMAVTSAKTDSIIPNRSELLYNDNSILIQLASPGYINPDATYLEYQLQGSSDTSKYKLLHPYSLSFVSLKPGRYSLQVNAVDFQGQVSDPLVFSFVIKKPTWQQDWFIAALFILGFALLFILFRLRDRNVKKKNKLLIEKLTLQNDLRKSILKMIGAQMNPHFIFNALNTIQSFVYNNDKQSVSNYLGKFSELIRKILDSSNIEAITLEEEIHILGLYLDLEKARFEDSLTIKLDIQKELDTEEIYIPPMFIQPYIENAIKHGLLHKKGERLLDISMGHDNENSRYIKIVIEDNGVGRDISKRINNNTSANHKSFSTSAMENRVNLINQTLSRKIIVSIIDKPNAQGTIVVIRLPLINEPI